MSVLVIAECNGNEMSVATQCAITAAQQIGEVTCLIAGDSYVHRLAEPWAELIAANAKGFTHVVMGSSSFSKNVLPRAAALANAEPIADVVKINSPTQFVRPIYAGDMLQTVESEQPCLFLTVRPTAFEKATADVATKKIDTPSACSVDSKWVADDVQTSDRPELSSADIVFSGGRGLQSKANFDRLEKIAEKYNAAVGASRAAVDADMAPNDWQVGQTGQIVAPQIYVAIGISGATQHLAGMKDSKTVIAINKDPDAPIFSVADYGLVADADALLSALEKS
jgi:electron transfer flavoprotein alpha subunit